ncbi:hypothetical protein A9W98_18020 [Mycobacterium gordonae]|uniref:Uncharacterized protein n=1 Tax=Mycobacterium gordonae TaxID=1778 RepID=A0A1A6BHS3_MYCGO|nr:hypothetical protein [Mycobacterium gordonae]OBS01880.1 hypothetical protein A9W98_18020 [Mycobacterium gordonae]
MPDSDGFRFDIACPDQPSESAPCAIRDGYPATTNGDCRTCGKHTGPAAGAPGYPTPELEQQPDPERESKISAAVDRMRALNAQLEVFHAARRIAENPALLSSAAVKQIRSLYADYDTKHPTQEGQQQ